MSSQQSYGRKFKRKEIGQPMLGKRAIFKQIIFHCNKSDNIKLIIQKLVTGAATLQRETISQLMTLISKLTMKKEFLENDNSTSIITQMGNIEDDPAWRLHKMFQSSL